MVSKVTVPCRIIFSGEYFAAYGAPALAFAVDRYVDLEAKPINDKGLVRAEIKTDLGEGKVYPNGDIEGKEFLKMYAAILKKIKEDIGLSRPYRVKITVPIPDVFTGMGLSSALGAAFARAIYAEEGKTIDREKLYEYAFLGDSVAHGIVPVGLSAKTVISGKGVEFERKFNGNIVNVITTMDYSLPRGTDLLIANTYKGKRAEKGALAVIFAKNYKINRNSIFGDEKERKKVIKNYLEIKREITENLNAKGDPDILGELLDKNHALLAKGGIVTEDVEKVRKIASENWALGSKLSGSGGEGALVLIYCKASKSNGIIKALKKGGFEALKLRPAEHGVVLSGR